MIMTLIFLISAVVLMICTVIELMLAGGTGGMILRPSFAWLIAGWSLWLGLFYAYRKINKKLEKEDDYNVGNDYF